MGFRVDNVKVVITVNVEFEGSHDIAFEFAPEKKFDFDLDPVVKELLDRNRARLLAAVKNEQQAGFFF